MRLLPSCLGALLLLTSCGDPAPAPSVREETTIAPAPAPANAPTKARRVLDRALEAHGGERYERAHYRFVFRDRTYTFRNDSTGFTYVREQEKDGQAVRDQLRNGTLTRTVAGKPARLSKKDSNAFANSVNSVIYFATLPHKLTDPAVRLAYGGTDTLAGATYDLLDVSFGQEGGGKDFEDNFRYWINQSSDRIDYLAYDYRTDGGGVRFRSAYNPRVVDGVLFQDYVNYEAPIGTPLAELSGLFAAGELKELSRIETEDVTSLAE